MLTRAAGEPTPCFVADGVRIHRTAAKGESAFASLVYVGGSSVNVLAQRARTDLVHADGALSPGTIALAATSIGIPSVVTPLGAGPPGDLARLREKPAGRRRLELLARRSHFIALSEEIEVELLEAGAAKSRIWLVPNGVDISFYRPPTPDDRRRLRTELALAEETFYAVFVGRLHPVKNVQLLLDALVRAPEIELLLVGDGAERPMLERRASDLGVQQRVRFVGFSDRVPDYLRAADAFVLPSLAEGMPNALLEAMACGLPCVASCRAAGVPRLLGEGRGLSVDPTDAEGWAAALLVLADDAAQRRALGAAAGRYVHREQSLDRIVDRLRDVYREIVSRT